MNRRYPLLCQLALLLACLAPTVVVATPPRQLMDGHVPPILSRLEPLRPLSGQQDLTLAIGLPFRNRQLLTNLLDQIYDPKSTNYHHYLTPEQFTETFGPTAQDYQALADFVTAQGLTVTGTHSNRAVLDVRAPVAEIERAFHVTLRVYQHPTEDRTFFAPDTEPSLDCATPVLHISGLDDCVLPHPNLKLTPLGVNTSARPNVGSGPGGSYMGSDFRKAYAPGVSLTGAGQVVGLLEFDGYDPNDIARYEAKAGLPSVPLRDVPLDDFSGRPGTYNQEVCLDIEMVISMAPGLSKVVVYEAPYTPTSYLDILNEMIFPTQGQPFANQLSCSWTLPQDANSDQAYQQLIIQGQSFFQSSGDWGAYYPGILQLSDSRFVTIVGGTTLTTSPSGAWQSETTWNNHYDATAGHSRASGGGISQRYPLPSWQQGVANLPNQGSSTMRNVPDVSMVADGIWITYNSGSDGPVGGTSAAAPLWAGFMALVNEQAAANAEPTAGFINPAIYAIGNGPNYSIAIHDVGDYSNNANQEAGFWAAPGYDLCTGWGTPNGQNLINLLAPPPPHIDSVSPTTFLTSSSRQPLYIYGSGFTANSTLLFNGSTASDASRLQVKSANEIDYQVIVQSAGTWSVQVVNGIQRSNAKNFTVSNAPPTTGSLVVNLAPAGIGAQWQVDNTGYNNSGYAVGYLAPGAHTVSFKPVAGYTTPANLSVNIFAGQQTTTNATYTPIAPTTYTLTLNAASGQGSVSASPAASGGIYNSGSVVQLTAYANTGYHFTGWGGDLSGTANPASITMNGNKTVTANFASGDPNLATVTVTIKPDAAVTAGVTWSVTGDSQHRDSGTSLSESVGSGYTTYLPITLNLVAGWLGTNGASSFFVPITAGTVTNVTLTCVPDITPGLLTVTLSPQDAVSAGAHWHVNGGTYGNGASVSLPPGNYTVTFDAVAGWAAPPSQPVMMQPAQTVVLAGNYTPPVGQPVIGSISPPIGSMAGGTVMTINGANFSAPAVVLVGGQAASNVIVSGATQITCLTPPSTNFGSAGVVVQTGGGRATNANGFAYGAVRGTNLDLVSAFGGSCFTVAVKDTHAYVGEGRNLLVLDVSTPSNPSKIGQVTLPGPVMDVSLFGAYAYVASLEGGLQVVDVNNPTTPKIRGFYAGTNAMWMQAVKIFGGRAYVADQAAGLIIFDLGNPVAPRLIAMTNCGAAQDVAVKTSSSGTFAFVTDGSNLRAIDVSNPASPTVVAQISIGTGVNSITISGNYIFGAEMTGKIHMIDVSTPTNPIDNQPPTGDNGTGGYVQLGSANGYLYAQSSVEGIGFCVFRIEGTSLTKVGQSIHVYGENGLYAKMQVVIGNQAYVPNVGSGLRVMDVSNPFAPSLLANFNDSDLFGVYWSAAVSGNTLSANAAGMKVFDLTRQSQTPVASLSKIGGSYQILARDYNVYYIANDGIRIYDVSSPGSPQLKGTIPNTVVYAHSMALAGAALFITGNSSGNPRFVAADVSNPSSPVISGTKDYLFGGFTQGYTVAAQSGKAMVGIVGATNEVSVLDISQMSAPVERARANLAAGPLAVKISGNGNYAYVIEAEHPCLLHVYDISNPSNVASVTNLLVDGSFSVSLALRSTDLYVATSTGLYVFDVSNQSMPVRTRAYAISYSSNDGICVPSDSPNQSGKVFLADRDGGLVILGERDKQVPQVFITTPWSLPVYTNESSAISLGGGSDDNVGVTAMTWSNSRGGSGPVSPPLDNWYVTGIPLYPGSNVLTVTAFDAAGNSGSDTLTVIYQAPRQNQTITFPALSNRTFGDPPFPLAVAASSGLPVSFSVVSGTASLSNNVLTLLGAGTVTVQANQPGNDFFNPAPATNVSFIVAKAGQAIAFAPMPDKSAGDPPFALSATASSGLPVSFSIVSGPAVLSTNNVVTLLGGGLVTVRASQPGNSNYNAALPVDRNFNVARIPQTITFGALSRQTVGDAPFPLMAAASSGLAVSFAVLSGPAALSGNVLTLTGAGTVVVRASQLGDAVYAPAASVDQAFVVVPGVNVITDWQRSADGRFHLTFAGEFGRTYAIESSTNLLNWTALTTNTLDGLGNLDFTDISATNQTRFYRARRL